MIYVFDYYVMMLMIYDAMFCRHPAAVAFHDVGLELPLLVVDDAAPPVHIDDGRHLPIKIDL